MAISFYTISIHICYLGSHIPISIIKVVQSKDKIACVLRSAITIRPPSYTSVQGSMYMGLYMYGQQYPWMFFLVIQSTTSMYIIMCFSLWIWYCLTSSSTEKFPSFSSPTTPCSTPVTISRFSVVWSSSLESPRIVVILLTNSDALSAVTLVYGIPTHTPVYTYTHI